MSEDAFGESFISSMRTRFSEAGNPLWVWQAILACTGGVTGTKHDLPDWCIEYLATASAEINELWRRSDPHNAAQTPSHARISTADAVAHVANSLGLSRRGFNAFKDASAALQTSKLAVRHDVEMRVDMKMTAREASESLMSSEKLDAASLGKKLARGRRLTGLKKREKRTP